MRAMRITLSLLIAAALAACEPRPPKPKTAEVLPDQVRHTAQI